jgi:hypothetical protein
VWAATAHWIIQHDQEKQCVPHDPTQVIADRTQDEGHSRSQRGYLHLSARLRDIADHRAPCPHRDIDATKPLYLDDHAATECAYWIAVRRLCTRCAASGTHRELRRSACGAGGADLSGCRSDVRPRLRSHSLPSLSCRHGRCYEGRRQAQSGSSAVRVWGSAAVDVDGASHPTSSSNGTSNCSTRSGRTRRRPDQPSLPCRASGVARGDGQADRWLTKSVRSLATRSGCSQTRGGRCRRTR